MEENQITNIHETFDFTILATTNQPTWLEEIIIDNERVIACYKTIRDVVIFTNKRIILSNKQGITGKKNEIYSIPYYAINLWSSESNGHFDVNANLCIHTKCLIINFNVATNVDIREIDRIIATYTLK